MELMEPMTYILDAGSTKLKDADKWKDGLGIEDFLAATQCKSLRELKEVSSLIDPDPDPDPGTYSDATSMTFYRKNLSGRASHLTSFAH